MGDNLRKADLESYLSQTLNRHPISLSLWGIAGNYQTPFNMTKHTIHDRYLKDSEDMVIEVNLDSQIIWIKARTFTAQADIQRIGRFKVALMIPSSDIHAKVTYFDS